MIAAVLYAVLSCALAYDAVVLIAPGLSAWPIRGLWIARIRRRRFRRRPRSSRNALRGVRGNWPTRA